jgi:hypothetical protein
MVETRADEYRRWAAQCLSFADQAELDDDKATWLEAAGQWQRMAEEVDPASQQAQQPQPKEKR